MYLAQHPRLPRCDALKLLPSDWSANPQYRARFNREADLASTLWHPHIVGVHDRGEEDGQLWISMDFVDGLDAARLLADRYPRGMSVEEVARIVTAVASALDYAHKHGLLHRDVKPSNIMLTHLADEEEQRIILTDFGIARNLNEISGLTETNMAVGTVAYSAPEQLLGEELDSRADQYSLAATAYQLFTNSVLFPHSNPIVVSNRQINNPPPALSKTRPELSKLDDIIATALAKDPKNRFPKCKDFADAIAITIGRPVSSPKNQKRPVAKPAAGFEKPSTTATPSGNATKFTASSKPIVGTKKRTPTSARPANWLNKQPKSAIAQAKRPEQSSDEPQVQRPNPSSNTRARSWIFAACAVLTVVFLASYALNSEDNSGGNATLPKTSPSPYSAQSLSGTTSPPGLSSTFEPATTSVPALSLPQAPSGPRSYNRAGGFSFVIPPGWVESDASHLDYGSALLSKSTGVALPGQLPPVAHDTRIILGRLDDKIYASAETTNLNAAARLASDMGEFFMPYPGTRINQESTPLNGSGLLGSTSYYEVRFNDTTKPNGQIWVGVVGSPPGNASSTEPPQRWFVVYLGTSNDPVDKLAAENLANSLRLWTPNG